MIDFRPCLSCSNSNPIHERPDLEKEDSSNHHEALHAFAAYLAQERDAATATLVAELAKSAGFWVNSKAELGKFMLRIGTALTKELDELKKKRVRTTTELALRQVHQPGPSRYS